MLRVASIQLEPQIGETAANLAKISARVAEASAGGAALAVLPELANTGYVFSSREEAFNLAEPVPDGESARVLAALAAQFEMHLVIGLTERDGQKLFNTSVLFGPDGYIGKFRKVHLWGDENLVFEPGDLRFPVFHTPLGRIGTFICYDGWFPESYRSCSLAGADIICIPTNWVPIPG